MFIKNPDTLRKAIRKYDLVVLEVQSTSGHGQCKHITYIHLAKRGSGKRGGHLRNSRMAILSPIDALPFIGTRKVNEPADWLKSVAARMV